MKKLSFLLTVIFTVVFLGCSSDDNSGSNGNNPDNNLPDDSIDLSEYELPECDEFVNFSSSNSSLLLHLRALGYDLNNDGKISCSEAENIIELDLLNDKRISDLKGIESLINLRKISGTLNMNHNVAANFYNNINLEEILFNVSSTTGVSSHVNKIVLPNSNSLKIIDCSRTVVSELININNQSNLEILNMSLSGLRVPITNSGYEVFDISSCENLIEVNLRSTSIGKINLGNLPYLKKLNISGLSNPGNDVRSLSYVDLSGLPSLEHLDVSQNILDNLNIENNLNLITLNLMENKIPTLNLTSNTQLEELYASSNLLMGLNLNNNTHLKWIYLNNNDLTSLDLSENINLQQINLKDNKLTTLSVNNGNNVNIGYMNTINNNLSCIKIDAGFNPPPYLNWLKDNNTIYSDTCQ